MIQLFQRYKLSRCWGETQLSFGEYTRKNGIKKFQKALEEVSEMTPQTPEKFTIPAHGHYPEWSVTIEELLTLGRMRRYGRGGWNTKEDLSLSLLGQYHSRAEWEWYDDGKKMDFYNEQILPRIDEIWEYYQSNKKRIDKINKAEFNRRYK